MQVYVGLPDRATRVGILNHYLSTIEHILSPEDVNQAAIKVAGWSGAEIQVMCSIILILWNITSI